MVESITEAIVPKMEAIATLIVDQKMSEIPEIIEKQGPSKKLLAKLAE